MITIGQPAKAEGASAPTHTHTSIEKGKSVIISRIYTEAVRERANKIKYKEMKRKEKVIEK